MKINEKATKLHESGFNCAQSVFCACGDYTGMDDKTAKAVSGGFGGGVRCGEICGAVTGGVMAVGACFPYDDCANAEAKERIAELTRELTGRFKAEFGRLRCDELKADGCSCPKLIEYGAELAESIIKENK